MRAWFFIVCLVYCTGATSAPTEGADAFAHLQSLAGEWEADLPGYGKLTNSIRLISNGKAIEETIGTPADNEVSVYTRANGRVLLTHFCALTSDGHVVRLETDPLKSGQNLLDFSFVGATNLHSSAAPHMRRVVLTFVDRDYFSEKWTKSENGGDTVFELNFTRR